VTSPAGPPAVLPMPVPLMRADRTRTDVAILRLADAELVQHVVDTWLPLLRKHRTPDADWKWAKKTLDVCYTIGVEHVAITHQGQVQGVMVTSLPDSPPPLSVLPDLLYVEYVAVAPLNRPLAGKRQIFRAVGPVLLKHAARRSIREGREGRLGLHSELYPDTLRFYRETIGLTSRGADHDEEAGREYFEGDATWASKFLTRR
jgi:hypothetical protein